MFITNHAVLIIKVLILLGNAKEVACFNHADTNDDLEQRMRTSIKNYINSKTDEFGNNFLIAGFVTLVFHDCVGGCNGCINNIHPMNFPVIRYVHEAEHIYRNFSRSLSRADFWALAGIVATNIALGDNLGKIGTKLVYRSGRIDCPTSPFTNVFNRFPSNGGHGDFNDVLNFLQQHFHYSDRQAVAIMGAHTLGRMRRDQSGFIGSWTTDPNTLDNQYFMNLVHNDWVQVNTAIKSSTHRKCHDQFQWTNRTNINNTFESNINVPMALNADISIYRNIVTNRFGEVKAPINNIPFSRTKAIVEEFSRSNEIWLEEYIPAFQEMIQAGYEVNESGDLVPIENKYPEEHPWSD